MCSHCDSVTTGRCALCEAVVHCNKAAVRADVCCATMWADVHSQHGQMCGLYDNLCALLRLDDGQMCDPRLSRCWHCDLVLGRCGFFILAHQQCSVKCGGMVSLADPRGPVDWLGAQPSSLDWCKMTTDLLVT